MDQISGMLKNDCIEECKGPWGTQNVLTEKPLQEHIGKIEDFVWRMFVLYGGLNKKNRPFEYPISQCDDYISMIEVGAYVIYLITVDTKQGYHQVTVNKLQIQLNSQI